MTDKEFLRSRSASLRQRIRHSSKTLNQELEKAVGPSMREHPRSGLAAGGAAGFAVGSAIGAARRPAGSPRKRGILAGLGSFVLGTGTFALRSTIINSLLGRKSEDS